MVFACFPFLAYPKTQVESITKMAFVLCPLVLLQIQQMVDDATAEMEKLLAAKTKELLG